MTNVIAPQEEATVRAFIVRERRERFLELLPNPKRRHVITKSLGHPNPAWFDSRYVKPVPNLTNAGIAHLLRAKGAGAKCWAISESSSLDGQELELLAVLDEVVGCGIGTIICCVPGKLAFVESEDGRFIWRSSYW